jgi:putative GTP pyrophosphokinase
MEGTMKSCLKIPFRQLFFGVLRMKLPNKYDLQTRYVMYLPVMNAIAKDIESHIEKLLQFFPSRPMVKSRVKTFESFYKKHIRILQSKEDIPITDLIGIRVVCPFIDDISLVISRIKTLFNIIEIDKKTSSKNSFKEFGYESTHLLIQIPEDCITTWGDCGCTTAEIQIRTALQDAWAEVEHELVYKTEFAPLDEIMKRKLAAVSASLSLADTIFQDVRNYQWDLSGQNGRRWKAFFKQVDESTGMSPQDSVAMPVDPTDSDDDIVSQLSTSNSIDALLLNALYAHNKKQFNQAIEFYTNILDKKPVDAVASVIYKHRGTAFVANSQYDNAINDFSEALKLDPASYKAAYCRGIAYSITGNHFRAIEDFSLSLDINPYQSFCYYRRGLSFFHIGDFTQALADCNSALLLEPEEQVVLVFKKMLLDKLNL